MANELRSYDLTLVEFNFLTISLEIGREVTATEMAQLLPVDPPRISRVVSALVAKGLLRRRRLRNDRRIVMLCLTDEGMDLTLRARQGADIIAARITEGISVEEKRVFMSVISKIAANHVAVRWTK